mmetsp:Transcript_20691/g.30405  ORF Transcript_20691/g.30405 Transcript_20691/m.30405 type:complete len:101 (+) Transcript_20691:168-470(+)
MFVHYIYKYSIAHHSIRPHMWMSHVTRVKMVVKMVVHECIKSGMMQYTIGYHSLRPHWFMSCCRALPSTFRSFSSKSHIVSNSCSILGVTRSSSSRSGSK